MGRLFAITSGKGGVGKSSVATHLATALGRMGHRVLLVDLDAGMRCLDLMLNLSDRLPAGVRYLAEQLKKGVTEGTIDPFARRITAQDGTVKNDGSRSFTPEELLHMDWLCDNVVGSIPAFRDLLPGAQPLVRELGIYRDIPEKEEMSHENPDRIR